MHKFILISVFVISVINFAGAQMYIRLTSTPQYYMPLFDTLHVPGAFNNWIPNAATEMISPGLFRIPAFTGTTEYKITRGSWTSVEASATGADINNRTLNYVENDTVEIQVLQWKDFYSSSVHTATPEVKVMQSDFYMPQFKRDRRVWIYLPDDYYTSSVDYPVLYMHDGQNLFDKPYSFVGEWKIDEALNQLNAGTVRSCIVIGIDNGGGERISEYTPYKHPTYGGGSGEAYADFLVQTLKPFVDGHFRTLKEPENTGIAGSSLGGLISYYTALKYPEVFGKVGVFSPSFWYSDSLLADVESYIVDPEQKFYIVAGQNEDADMVPDIDNYIAKMKARGVKDEQILRLIKSDGQHSEWFWAREFPAAYTWLDLWNAGSASADEVTLGGKFLTIKENPSHTPTFVVSNSISGKKKVVIYDANGKTVQTNYPDNELIVRMDSTAKAGVYYASFTSGPYHQVIKFIKL